MLFPMRNTSLTVTIGPNWSLESLRNDIWCKNGEKTPLMATCWGSPSSPWTCTPCSSPGVRPRPQVWHINQVTILDRHSLVVAPGLWDAKWPTFFLSGRPKGQEGSWCPPRGPGRKTNDLIPSHQYLDMSWADFKRNLPEYTRKGPCEPPQHGHFSLFCLIKTLK